MLKSQSQAFLEDIKVLVIDDNAYMRGLMISILHSLGVRGLADSGEAMQAFEKFQNFEADIIIVDWMMEPVDGMEFVRMVRTGDDSPNPFVPIIMISGVADYPTILEARDAGVNEFLRKPLSAKTVFERIVSILDNPRPFVRSDSYFGPCRRRRDLGPPEGMAERRSDTNIVTPEEQHSKTGSDAA